MKLKGLVREMRERALQAMEKGRFVYTPPGYIMRLLDALDKRTKALEICATKHYYEVIDGKGPMAWAREALEEK